MAIGRTQGDVNVRIGADTKPFNDGLSKAKGELLDWGGEMQKAGRRLGDLFGAGALVGGVVAATYGVVNFAREIVKLGADAEALEDIKSNWKEIKQNIADSIPALDEFSKNFAKVTGAMAEGMSIWPLLGSAISGNSAALTSYLDAMKAVGEAHNEARVDEEALNEAYKGVIPQLEERIKKEKEFLYTLEKGTLFEQTKKNIQQLEIELKKLLEVQERVFRPEAISLPSVASKGVDSLSYSFTPENATAMSVTADMMREKLTFLKEEVVDLSEEIKMGLTDAIYSLSEAFGQMFQEGGLKNFGQTILSSIGNFMKLLGGAMISMGIASIQFKTALKALQGPGMIIAGAALVAAGSALGAIASSGPSGSGGGGGYPSGGNSGGGSFRIAPVQVEGILKGKDIYITSQRYGNTLGRTT